ncbi:MAG TPA: LuxR C-terminal-related transcriptional regulator [Steroidobacteraceae bacterium]|jgi:LuxR family maltose regulon positive regulatory protein|nr:LuxR C-terminal-related transcriptional regulator [Steroidobacteraceae bacterium]
MKIRGQDQSVEDGRLLRCSPAGVRRLHTRPPGLKQGWVARRTLAQWRSRIQSVPLTVIRAPAGYGKTTLLAQLHQAWRDAGQHTAWLSVTDHEREPQAFLAALAMSCMLPGSPEEPFARQLTRLINGLTDRQDPIYLLLDDADRLLDCQSGRLLHELAESMPDGAHLLCAGRGPPPLPLARDRGYGRLYELDAAALSFDADDVRSLLCAAGVEALAQPQLEQLLQSSEGWPMIVQRAVASMAAQHDPQRVLDGLSGRRRDIAEFFETEVLGTQSAPTVNALEALALCGCAAVPLVQALTGIEDSAVHLAQACDHSLFVSTVGPEGTSYRVHRLLAEALCRRVERHSPTQAAALHLRAAAWYEEAGQLVEAVDHAIQGGDAAWAARLFELHCDDFYEAGNESAILPLANRIPAQLRRRYPRLLLAMSWRLQTEWQFAKARTLLMCARERIEEIAATAGEQRNDLPSLRHHLLHSQVMQAQFEDNFAFIDRHAQRLLRSCPSISPYVRGSLYSALLWAGREQYRLGRVDSLAALARQQFQAVPSRYVTAFLEAIIAPADLIRGRARGAIATLSAALRTALDAGGPSVGSLVALPLAEAYYDCAQLPESRALLEQYLPYSRQLGFADQLLSGYITQARLARMRGERAGALSVLEEAVKSAMAHQFDRLAQMLRAEQVDLLCRFGAATEASQVATSLGLGRGADSVMPDAGVTRLCAALAYAWTSLAPSRGRLPEAIQVARKWRNLTEAAGALRDSCRWNVRLVVLLRRASDDRAARRELRRAVRVAASACLAQPFLEDIDSLGPMILSLAEAQSMPPHGLAADPATDLLLQRLTLAARPAPDTVAHGSLPARTREVPGLPMPALAAGRSPGEACLSFREIEIVRLAGRGLSNAQIGRCLSIVEGTVKWHLQGVFDKLGTRRRMLAVERARSLGLLAPPA